MTRLSCAAVLLLVYCSCAVAAPGNSEHKSTTKTSTQHSDTKSKAGTTIVGEDESPIGLYITPWKNDYANPKFKGPHQRLQEFPTPINPDTFHRQNEYYDTITAYRNAHLAKSAAKTPAQNQ